MTSTRTQVRLPSRVALPAFSSRLQVTGHFLQRGRERQHFPLAFTTRRLPLATTGTVALRPMPADAFAAKLNEQIANEFAAHQQYVAIAVHFDGETLPQLAGFFYRQAIEERDHAMMMVQYLLDTDAEVRIPGVEAPVTAFEDVVAPVALALAQEKRVTEQINALAGVARASDDYTSEQFMQWFIKEQVEEVATMSDLLRVAERSREVKDIEDYVAR